MTASSINEQSRPTEALQAVIFAEEERHGIRVSDPQLLQAFAELYDEIRSVTASNEEVIYLPDAPYETVGSILVAQGDRVMEYSFFAHHSDAYLKDARNVIYVTLSEKGDTRGYLLLEDTDLHRRTEEFFELFLKAS